MTYNVPVPDHHRSGTSHAFDVSSDPSTVLARRRVTAIALLVPAVLLVTAVLATSADTRISLLMCLGVLGWTQLVGL